jgi:hypothetical protein
MIRLLFGCYAWTQDESKKRVLDAGSGIFVAPGLGLTARHVTQGFNRLDDEFEAFRRRSTPLDPQYAPRKVLTPGYREMVYQISGRGVLAAPHEASFWQVSLDWPSKDTDISVLQILPLPGISNVTRELRYLDWYLQPPPIGAVVRLYGFPNAIIETDPIDHVLDLGLEMQKAKVVEWLEPIRAHGFGEFPTFRLNREFEHGFSGGPVLWNDHLVGIFSGPDLVATLWPLVLFSFRDEPTEQLSQLFDSGVIDAKDWQGVKDRVTRLPCDEALADAPLQSRCTNSHAVLRPA